MAIRIDSNLKPADLMPAIGQMLDLSAVKLLAIEESWRVAKGAPVFTAGGRYTSRGWTEWTQGFQFGSLLLQYDATGDKRFLKLGRERTLQRMASHLSHIGVHDHGFNNVSTYGNLRRLILEGRVARGEADLAVCEIALKVSGAVQAARWTELPGGAGYIYSFNGPHSLFVDTIRSLRALAIAHQLGHVLLGERDRKISLLGRMLQHAEATAVYSVFYGKGRDAYDLRGRTAHECIFNLNDGSYRCPNSQQGYSPFSTWTRGLAWALLGFAEELEFFDALSAQDFAALGGAATRTRLTKIMLEAASAAADFYLENTCTDGIPMWDTGAPGLHHLGDYLSRNSDPHNDWEPVDSSAAAIAAQGLLRLGHWIGQHNKSKAGRQKAVQYRQAGLTVARTLFSEPYLSMNPAHQGLILHSVYHRPNGWDHIARGQKIPNGESSMWGDYHARELALLIQREAEKKPRLVFFDGHKAH
ncbi:MAG: glycosyl hydrolase [Limisphaerales bacterium]|jgi:unsaturated chondroitin disaccharide hydrolase